MQRLAHRAPPVGHRLELADGVGDGEEPPGAWSPRRLGGRRGRVHAGGGRGRRPTGSMSRPAAAVPGRPEASPPPAPASGPRRVGRRPADIQTRPAPRLRLAFRGLPRPGLSRLRPRKSQVGTRPQTAAPTRGRRGGSGRLAERPEEHCGRAFRRPSSARLSGQRPGQAHRAHRLLRPAPWPTAATRRGSRTYRSP